MFENQSDQEIEALINSHKEFRALYARHKELKEQIGSAERGKLPMDELTLHALKKEKLRAKDRLATIWTETHPAAG